jgi:hypothetical protein
MIPIITQWHFSGIFNNLLHMDSEKHHEIQKLIKNGRSPCDEGPFYHHTFWESYKGSIKGKLGGLIIGGMIGAIVGAAASLAIPAISATAIMASLAAAGALYGAHEFGESGRVTGAIAAAENDAEKRMRALQKSQFAEIKQDISELKSIVKGEPVPETSARQAADNTKETEKKLADYRVTHHDETIPKPKGGGLIFWKVAMVGLAVGAGLGFLLASAGVAAGVGAHIGILAPLLATPATAAVTLGAIGASFGINRDVFRKIFDKTDLLFQGITDFKKPKLPRQHTIEKIQTLNASSERPKVSTLVYHDSGIDYPTSATFHQDKLIASAKQALAAMDHTTASRH